jgi:Protein of unknown function (DUF3311)
MQKRLLLAVAIAAVYLLHQDVWFWRTARPLVLGFLPVGLAWHAAYCLLAAALMWALTALAWPEHLDRDARSGAGQRAPAGDGPGGV